MLVVTTTSYCAGFISMRMAKVSTMQLSSSISGYSLATSRQLSINSPQPSLKTVFLCTAVTFFFPPRWRANSNAVRAAADLPGLYDAMKSKRYAHARLRRYVLAAALGYTEALPALPPYVHVLAANRRGLALLRGAKKPAGASLARLSRENEACRAAAAAHAVAADLAALCRRAPGPMGGCYTEKPLLVC